MKSVHLKHTFEHIVSTINLEDTALFFNKDGTVNLPTLYKKLKEYGITKDVLEQAINQRDTTILLNKYDIPIATVEETTIGDMVVKWLSMGIHDNAILEFSDRWSADNPPVVDTYLDPTTIVWRELSGDIPSGNNLRNLIEGDAISVRGLSCTYGKIDVSAVRAGYNQIPTYVDGDGVQHYYNMAITQNALLTLYPSGKVDRYSVEIPMHTSPMSTIIDVARFGAVLYGFAYATTKLFKISGPWDGGKQGFGYMTEDPNFSYPEISGVVSPTILDTGMTVIANKLYVALNIDNNKIVIMGYDILNNDVYLLPNGDDYPLSKIYGLEFISENRFIYFNKTNHTIRCEDIDTTNMVWEIPAPKYNGNEYDITGISYDPINNYLYMVTNNALVRYTCP